MKKVLIITYSWPPSNESAVHRVLRLGRWLPKHGWEPYILTPRDTICARKDYGNIIFSQKYFKNVKATDSKVSEFIVKLFEKRNTNIIAKITAAILYRILVPDVYIHWVIPGIKDGLTIIREHNIDVIWATLNPYSTGLMAAYLAKKTGVPLLIDYRDPWTLSRIFKISYLKQRINKFIEKKMLEQASAICTTSKPMSELFVTNGYFNKDRVFTITNSVDDELQHIGQYPIHKTFLDSTKFNITHIGTFYGDRQPFEFIKALALIVEKMPDLRKKIKVNFLGNGKYGDIRNYCNECKVEDMFFFEGYIPYSDSMIILSQSDLLLLLNGVAKHNEIYIPGKLFDYLAVKKPILFIGNGQPTEIISELNIGESTDQDALKISQTLLKMIQNLKTYHMDEHKLKKYSSLTISKQMVHILEKIKK